MQPMQAHRQNWLRKGNANALGKANMTSVCTHSFVFWRQPP